MDSNDRTLKVVPDDELLRRLIDLVAQSHRVEADLVAHIGEVDERKLFARLAFPSMFAYCTEGLHLSEAEAYRRITVARAARRYPALLAMLRDGRLHLSGLARLVPLLTEDNCQVLLERATHLSKRQIEALVVEFAPRPDAPSVVRKLPQKRPPAQPLAVDRQVSVSEDELVPGRVEERPGPDELPMVRVSTPETMPARTPSVTPPAAPSSTPSLMPT